MTNSTSITDLHNIFQIILEWSDDHLNQFTIHGKIYGVYHDGGVSFSDDPSSVYLKDFQFRPNEKFKYEYNFTDGWEYEIRFEKTLPIRKLGYPHCLDGARLAPPEDCGGPLAFLELDKHYSIFQIQEELVRLIKRHKKDEGIINPEELELEDYDDDDVFEACDYDIDNFADGIATLNYWYHRNVFDRHKINRLLQTAFSINKEETNHAN